MLGLVRAKNKRKGSLPVSNSKFLEMERQPSTGVTFFFCVVLVIIAFNALTIVFAPLPSFTTHSELLPYRPVNGNRTFEIADDMFWKDGQPFQIIGGDLHYFRILPEYWEDRLLRAKALGLNTIQTYVPWNLHEPKSGKLVFEGIADIEAFLKLCQRLGLLVMLRAGPYICAEWDLGGFPAWLLSMEPSVKLRSSDPVFLQLVERWWGILLPKVVPLLYKNGGPIIMVQIENEFGSYGDDKTYLHQLVALARHHLRHDVILYTTDGGARENLENGTIRGDSVYSAVDFTTGDEPWPIFHLQKKFNAPGRSPPLTSEFYTGWLTHWGEELAKTKADFTAINLEKILKRNGSAVLYMAHGGTNFGFYNGANTESSGAGYKADLTSYDYDAPISESGDVDNAKFKALRKVIARYSSSSLAPVPPNNDKTGYGPIHVQKMASLFDLLNMNDSTSVIESENPMSMESVGQMFGFLLYTTEYTAKKERSTLFIPKVHDRAQVFTLCASDNEVRAPAYIGTVERESSNQLGLPHIQCATKTSLYILVENMGRINYGQYIFDSKGILSPVYLDGEVQLGWKMIPIPFHNLNEVSDDNHFIWDTYSILAKSSERRKTLTDVPKVPSFYVGHFSIGEGDHVRDTFMSFNGWGKGIAFVNEFNLGRYWPLRGPQCSLYVPAPILRHGVNVLILFELESANPELVVQSVDMLDFSCGPNQ